MTHNAVHDQVRRRSCRSTPRSWSVGVPIPNQERGPHGCNREGLNAQVPGFYGSSTRATHDSKPIGGHARMINTQRGRPRSERDYFSDPSGPRGKGRPGRAHVVHPVEHPGLCGIRVIPVAGGDVDHTTMVLRTLTALVTQGQALSPAPSGTRTNGPRGGRA